MLLCARGSMNAYVEAKPTLEATKVFDGRGYAVLLL